MTNGTGLTLPPQTSINWTKYMAQLLGDINNRQYRTISPGTKEHLR